MARTRTNNKPANKFTYREYSDNNRTVLINSGFVQLAFNRSETMVDDPVVSDSYFKDVTHTKTTQVIPEVELVNIGFPSNRWSNAWAVARVWTFESAPALPTLDGVDGASLATRALRQMMPSMNEGTSLVNFVLELKDLRREFTKWKKRYLKTSDTITRFGSRKGAARKKKYEPKESLSKTLSGEYLSYMFGWAPFISDLKGMYDGLKKFKSRLAWFRQNAGKVLKRQYRRILPGYSDYEDSHTFWMGGYCSSIPNNSSYPFTWRRKVEWFEGPQYSATLIYRYTIPEMSEAEMKVKGFLDMLGVRLDPSIIWNAIPFSFLIDWVVDVSSWLRSFSVDNLGIKTEILDFCHSLKSVQISENYCRPFIYGSGALPREILTVQSYRSRYERRRVSPNLYALTGSGINMREASLGTALVLANRKNKRMRPTQLPSGQISDTSA